MKFLTTRRLGGLTAVALAATLLAACSSSPAPAPGGQSEDSGDGAPEKASLTIAINPSSQFAPMYYGMESGIFEDHGLELEIVPQTDVAAIVSGIASGTYDLGFATVVHVLTANANGIPIRTISTIEGQVRPDDEGTVTIASAASGITDFAGMEGKKLATVGLSSHNTLTAWALADEAGIDPKSIELVQLPFGQMAAALENGDVDAAVMQWPFAEDAMKAGGVPLEYNNRVMFQDTATTFFNTSQAFIDQNPNTVKAFSDAMVESIEAATADPDAARKALIPGLGLTPEQAAAARWNIGGVPQVNLKAFETAREFLLKYSEDAAAKSAIETLDVSTLVWPGALEKG
ncbi:ABC transporter substrate-binding protein [Microbacterium sp. zg.B48]|uniref:ABC transporter substrate-binding protein n=1 Tax=Microbacterium sp. zg.B48 TaxID=2969408 RepID=UPI00214B1993|nr:ABC transporter substrate-binding protein [Microbacterium sp. zg.B48]MCR2764293.1 ABC transporter substrate-binding protein [Microbacterium sp. zg.B48]